MIDGRFDAEFALIFARNRALPVAEGPAAPRLGALLHRALMCLRWARA